MSSSNDNGYSYVVVGAIVVGLVTSRNGRRSGNSNDSDTGTRYGSASINGAYTYSILLVRMRIEK